VEHILDLPSKGDEIKEAPSRVPSKRPRKPIQKTNADFVHTRVKSVSSPTKK
jgi:hypothetical protein